MQRSSVVKTNKSLTCLPKRRHECNICGGPASASATASMYFVALVALSFPLACCSEGTLQHQLLFVPSCISGACTKAPASRVFIDPPRLILPREPHRDGPRVKSGLLVAVRREYDLVLVCDTPRAHAAEHTVGEVKELSNQLFVPGVAMVLTLQAKDAVGLVKDQDVEKGSSWICVNGIPLKASKFEYTSNFWGTRKTLDISVRIPPEHLDEAGLGLLYPGDEVKLSRLEEADALDFQAKFAEAKKREREHLEKPPQQLSLVQRLEADYENENEAALKVELDNITALKAELDNIYPSLTRAQDKQEPR